MISSSSEFSLIKFPGGRNEEFSVSETLSSLLQSLLSHFLQLGADLNAKVIETFKIKGPVLVS